MYLTCHFIVVVVVVVVLQKVKEQTVMFDDGIRRIGKE